MQPKVVGSRVESSAGIGRDARVAGASIRALAARYHLHRRTVRQAPASGQRYPAAPQCTNPVLAAAGAVQAAIVEILRADPDAPRKQRHTARRVLARLVDEHDSMGLSYSTVCGCALTAGRSSAPRLRRRAAALRCTP
jgi:hypothetical protein